MRFHPDVGTEEELLSALYAQKNEREYGQGELFFPVCSALFSLFAIAGLFLGCAFETNVGTLIAGRQTMLGGALFGVILETVGGKILPPEGTGSLLFGMVYVLIAAVTASLFLTVFALLARGKAKPLAYANGWIVLFAYGGLFALSFLALAAETGEPEDPFDIPAASVATADLLLLTVMAFFRGKGTVANFFLLLFPVMSAFALFFPGTQLLSDLVSVSEGGALPMQTEISCLVLVIVIAFNVAASAGRLGVPNAYFFDIVRFGLQTLAALMLSAASLLSEPPYEIFAAQPLAFLLLLITSFAAFLLAAFAAALKAGKPSR